MMTNTNGARMNSSNYRSAHTAGAIRIALIETERGIRRAFDLKRAMRESDITIAELAYAMGVTMSRVREVRNGALLKPTTILDWEDGVRFCALRHRRANAKTIALCAAIATVQFCAATE